jgi:hypothetical protein
VPLGRITAAEARAAGHDSLESLREHLATGEGVVYRVQLHYAGADPRGVLREETELDSEALARLQEKLARLDARSRQGAWTWATLRAIARHPGLYSGDLADQLGFERMWLKAQIRKLKELGLTESLEVGYRISPRGEALLRSR